MKTQILSIATVLFLAFSTSNKTFAAVKTNTAETILTNVSNINKIEVHGNVELYVTSGDADKVKVYDSYYNQNALVQEQNGVLRISSYKDEKLVVWVTVNDLRSIAAYDNATVKSFGKFSAVEFDLNLNNNATANFDMDCFTSKVALNDNAKANISGNVNQSYIAVNQSATLNASALVAEQSVQKRVMPVVKGGSNTEEISFF